ncbi:hypothetical protein KUV65_00925 [Maritalea mobilis]|uniref:hypothetical protein n=1 Tax=Maritalea mobilis TaxID=483324 RepID=UPI001C989BD2|nr:hypothetical protein [Maritalea mobilis]MBY6199912.1 hypothetical protein [Maritalea mobilis]
MDILTLPPALALILGTYAVLAALAWLRRVTAEKVEGRRNGIILNLLRRAAPPVIGGIVVLILGSVMGVIGATGMGFLLITGGLAFGLHRGLDDLRANDKRVLLFRAAMTAAISMTLIWQAGLF